MDLSKLSNEDLIALQSGDLSKLSNDGLMALQASAQPQAEGTKAPAVSDKSLVAFGAGLGNGVGQAVLNAQGYLGKGIRALGGDTVGNWLINDSEHGLKKIEGELAPYKEVSPTAAGAGEIAGNVAATFPVGGVLAKGVQAVSKAPKAVQLANALRTGGFSTGAPAATTLGAKAADLGIRTVGGAVTGGTAAALIDPESAGLGAAIGGSLPGALKLAGGVGGAVGRQVSGPGPSKQVQQAASKALNAGYVIPPTQVDPTLFNRALEGLSGKISTAQNASAKNQKVTNDLVKQAIVAQELTEQGIAQVRKTANAAYDALSQSSPFQADNAFAAALDKAGSSTAELRKNFPELVNAEVDDLIAGLKSRGEFEAQPTIEAIKRLRANASANKISTDPAKKALGKSQNGIANALEDLIDRNLQKTGAQDLLTQYRAARQTLAKVYDVEKALNPASGNVDASKLAAALKKGRPLSGELRDVAEFASQFPKAAQTVEKMGSLPQVSPLDFGTMGALSAATSNPLMMAGVLARPLARSAALSGPVQRSLVRNNSQNELLAKILANPTPQQLGYRAAPLLMSDQ